MHQTDKPKNKIGNVEHIATTTQQKDNVAIRTRGVSDTISIISKMKQKNKITNTLGYPLQKARKRRTLKQTDTYQGNKQ